MMKGRIAFLGLIFWLLPAIAPAQSLARLEVGAHLGPALVDLGGPDADGEVNTLALKASYAVGVMASVRLHDMVSVQVELDYLRKGADVESDGIYRSTFNLSYLQVPLMARGQLAISDRVHPFVQLGAGVSWLLGAESVALDGTVTERDNIRSIDMGALVGAGAEMRFRWGIMDFEIRYDHGLTTVDDAGDGDIVQNRAVMFLLGYRYGVLPLGDS